MNKDEMFKRVCAERNELDSEVQTLRLENISLRLQLTDWQSGVSRALGIDRQCHILDAASEIRTLRQALKECESRAPEAVCNCGEYETCPVCLS